MADDDDWNFQVNKNDAPSKKKSTVTSKRIVNNNSQKNLKLNLDTEASVQRKSRRQLAKEDGGTMIKDRDIIDPAAHWRRGIAFNIDLIVLILFFVVGQGVSSVFMEFGQSIEDFLGPQISTSIPFDIGGFVIAFILHFLFVLVPMASSQRSLGKKILKLKILGTMKSKAPLGVIIIREYIAKPLSILSFIGILMIPLNRNRRGLHDYISGTIVIDNL